MNKIEYKQAIYVKNKFSHWHYWGFMPDLSFIGPDMVNGIAHALANSNSYVCTDKYGKEIYGGDKIKSGNGRIWEVRFGEYKYAGNADYAIGWYAYGEDGPCYLPLQSSQNMEICGSIHTDKEQDK